MEFGEIYLVNFDPSSGREYKKVRPAIIIQQTEISEQSHYVTVMPISSNIDRLVEPDVFLPHDQKNRLIKDSVIKVRQISSFNKRRFIKRVGVANSPTVRRVRGYLRKHFGM